MSKEKKLSKDKLLGWIDSTLKGWRTTELSHANALVNPSLNKAIKKDIEHLKQLKSLIEAQAEPSEAEIDEFVGKMVEMSVYVLHQDRRKFYKKMLKDYNQLRKRRG